MNQTLIRASRERSCVAHWETTGDGYIRLLRITPDTGPVPDVAHLIGAAEFPDLAALRRAVIAAMCNPVGDTLDRVLLTRSAYDRWLQIAADAMAAHPGIRPDSIPDERARTLSGGRLMIWVDLPNGRRVELILSPGEWAWRSPSSRNQ